MSSSIDSGGAAQQTDTHLDNLQGQITILKSALEGLAGRHGRRDKKAHNDRGAPCGGSGASYYYWQGRLGGLAKGIENIRSIIQKAMEGVSVDMTISLAAAVQEISVSGAASGPLIEAKEMNVRSDDDILKISQQLYRQLQQGRRANGYD